MASSARTTNRRRLTQKVADALSRHPTLGAKTTLNSRIRGGARGGEAVRIGRTSQGVVVEVIEDNAVQNVHVRDANIIAAEAMVRHVLEQQHIQFCGK